MVGFVFATRNPIHFYWWLCELCLENVRANFHDRFDDVKAKNWEHSMLLNLHKNFFWKTTMGMFKSTTMRSSFSWWWSRICFFFLLCICACVLNYRVSDARAEDEKKDVHIHFVIIVDGWNQFHCIWLLYGVFVVIHVAFFLLHRENIVWENICWYR